MKRPFRTINRINEDDTTGFYSQNLVNGVNRQVTGGVDAPSPVDLPELKNIVNIFKGKNKNSGDINIEQSITYNIGNASSSSGVADGLAFFTNHWKEFAIVAGAAAIIAGIAALVKSMNRTVKIRYNKVVKTLQRAQRDFTIKPDGLNMANVMPGVGLRIFDWVARFWTFNFKAKKHITGNIGLYPFCNQYIDEIATDFRTAQDAFSKIKLASDNEKKDGGYSSEGDADDTEKKKVSDEQTQHESFGVVRYNSFREAFRSDLLNEGVSEENINESALLALSAGITLASLAVRGGAWVVSKMKNGKPVKDSERIVNVTKESTREICYAIINNYADKYVNMKRVFKELGISTESLADLDESSCDKLQKILEKYAKPEKNAYTKQYGRIKNAYDSMLQHYYKIGDGIITNFVTFTESKDEKHANLVTASKEKLQNMWDSQKDFYNNNFSHIMIEITSSNAYISYLNFIIEKVIPVFRTGLAGQADYVLDVMPKKDEYYLLRQTKDQAWLEGGENNKGKTAIAKVIAYDEKENNIKFELVGLVKSDYSIESDGYAQIDGNDIDYGAYKENNHIKEDGLPYNKWMSLDPIILRWSPEITSLMFTRTKKVNDKSAEQFIYAVGDRSKGEDYKKIVFAEIIEDKVTRKVDIEISYKCNEDEFNKFVGTKSDDELKNMGFSAVWSNYAMSLIVRADAKNEKADNEERVVEIVNQKMTYNQKDVKIESVLYTKRGKEGDKDINEYIFAEVLENVESVDHKHDLTLNEEGEDEEKKDDSSNNGNKSDDNSNEPATQPAEDNEPDVVEPGTDSAKNNNITTIVYCTLPIDVSVDSEDLAKRINGSFITISNACSIDEFDRAVVGMGFTKSDEHPNKTKWAIRKAIIKRGHDANVEKYSITDLGSACDEIRERKTGSEKLFDKSERIAKLIYEKTKDIDITEDFDAIKPQKPSGSGFMSGLSRYCYAGQEFKGGYCAISTGVKDKNDNEINLYVYPTLVRKIEGHVIDPRKDLNKTAELRIFLFVGDEIHQTALNDEKDIKDKIDNIITSLIKRKKIDDSRFREIVQTVKSEGGTQSVDYKKQIADDVKILSTMVNREKVKDASSGLDVLKYAIKQQTNGNVSVNNADSNGTIIVMFNDLKINDKSFMFNIKCSNDINKILISVGKDTVECEYSKIAEFLVSVYEKLAKPNESQHESITVKYSVSDIVTEGYAKSTKLDMEFSDKLPSGWYIVTEGNYYDTSVKQSKLDESIFFKKLSHKDDINKYLKSTVNAKMMPFEQYSTTDVYSNFGYQPNGYTPLYESTILVKFDRDGNIIDKVQLPKQKIS